MTQKEAEQIVVDYLSPIFIERKFKYNKSKWHGFVKLYDSGFEQLLLSFNNHWPRQQPEYTICKRFNLVEDIYSILSDKFNFSETISYLNKTFWFNYGSLNFKGNSYLPPVETEEEMMGHAQKIKEFMIETGFPMLEKYSTLQAIDAEINGDDFWPTDWQHKFALGGGFPYKRLIIAKLCDNPRYDTLYTFHVNELEEIRKKYTNPRPLPLVDGKTAYQYLVEKLLKDVKPL